MWVANAGDSRAVLARGGAAVALSEDHKPAAAGERARITAAGGFISDVGGVSRCGARAARARHRRCALWNGRGSRSAAPAVAVTARQSRLTGRHSCGPANRGASA
jgi:hypothetical protein